jgi:Ca-activated chloride channel family protein
MMSEKDLSTLKDLPAPPPRAEAKAATLAAALAAFEAGEKNIPDTSKENGKQDRLNHASQIKRRSRMRVSMGSKMAASLAALTVATVGTLYFVGPQFNSRMAYERGGEGERRTALLERREQAGKDLGGKVSPPGGKVVYDRLGEATAQGQSEPNTKFGDGQPAKPASPPPDSKSAAVTRLAEEKAKEQSAARGRELSLAKPVPRAAQPAAVPQQGPAGAVATSEPMPIDGRAADQDYTIAQEERLAQPMPLNQPVDVAPGVVQLPAQDKDRDKFETTTPNPVKQVATEPVSTFSLDVDTASYAFMRRTLSDGRLPPKDAVRVEEMINYFPYDYPRPVSAEMPFEPMVTVMPSPWKATNKLVHIGVKGYDIVPTQRPRANLVFLIDISGSMATDDRLPLVKRAFRLMVDELEPDDTVGIVTYASGSGIALEPTRIADKSKILAAIDRLGAGGSTAGAQGLSDAYRLAEQHFDKSGVNRIILATDGDFNVGISNQDELKGFIERKREAGIFLSVLGVGEGNYNDALMQALAQNGNGTAAYVDTLNEARKVLVDEASSTLFTIAKDVKIQVEFNPAQVSEYRLIGYETRALKREDFNNDRVDAGDVGSGHTVTAIYEITPAGAPKMVDDLRYGAPGIVASPAPSGDGEYGFLKMRYKLPKEDTSKLISVPITRTLEKDLAAAPEDVRFSVAVAGFGQLLRGLPYVGTYSFDDVWTLAGSARGKDEFGYRAEFLNLVRLAKAARP